MVQGAVRGAGGWAMPWSTPPSGEGAGRFLREHRSAEQPSVVPRRRISAQRERVEDGDRISVSQDAARVLRRSGRRARPLRPHAAQAARRVTRDASRGGRESQGDAGGKTHDGKEAKGGDQGRSRRALAWATTCHAMIVPSSDRSDARRPTRHRSTKFAWYETCFVDRRAIAAFSPRSAPSPVGRDRVGVLTRVRVE